MPALVGLGLLLAVEVVVLYRVQGPAARDRHCAAGGLLRRAGRGGAAARFWATSRRIRGIAGQSTRCGNGWSRAA